MRTRWLTALIFLILLIPSARFAWVNRDLPNFARAHDDGILFVSAKSLATGGGYRVLSFPGAPPQTKYPVLYPLFLSVIWRLNPNFPANLELAALFCWVTVAVALALVWLYYRGQGWTERRTWLMAGLMAINPWVLVVGSETLSETFFVCFLLAALIAIGKPGLRMALLAGGLAGCAYLTRTAGVVMLATVPLVLIGKRERARAAVFLGAMLPFVIGWMLWSHIKMPVSSDPQLLYYTNYLGEWRRSVGLDNAALVLWKNLDDILYTLGELVLPSVFSAPAMKILTQTVGVAVICGVVRLARRGVGTQYAVFCLASAGVLLIWTPSTERLFVPMLPLVIAGFVEEMDHLFTMLKNAFHHKDRSQRVTAYGFASFAATLVLYSVVTQFCLSAFYLPSMAGPYRAEERDIQAASQWIAANTPPSARVLSGDDPLVYLYSGRQSNKFPFLYRWFYAGDHQSVRRSFEQIARYCRRSGYEYILASNALDTAQVTNEDDRAAILSGLEKNPDLKREFQSGAATVYRVEPQAWAQTR